MKKLLLPIAIAVFASGCAHHNDVRPTEGGVHYVKLMSQTKTKGVDSALGQAKHYCKKTGGSLVVVDESAVYTGAMDEQTYLSKLNIANAVEVVGTTMWIFGENSVDDLGAALSLGGGFAEDSMGHPYEVTISFKCS
ncbi:hypothetical protein ACSLBF_10865 [Pseudoalteromonas sp. T1lg65]|uniref:hypothetical protein n=1 Tax=Pseudoalteromonas sp. T1lg65 TaxID=2077101 RepID=UPI003F797A08